MVSRQETFHDFHASGGDGGDGNRGVKWAGSQREAEEGEKRVSQGCGTAGEK